MQQLREKKDSFALVTLIGSSKGELKILYSSCYFENKSSTVFMFNYFFYILFLRVCVEKHIRIIVVAANKIYCNCTGLATVIYQLSEWETRWIRLWLAGSFYCVSLTGRQSYPDMSLYLVNALQLQSVSAPGTSIHATGTSFLLVSIFSPKKYKLWKWHLCTYSLSLLLDPMPAWVQRKTSRFQ